MILRDIIYGEFEVNEPVIIDIINSPEMERLKYVDQAGYYKPHAPTVDSFYRYEHSIGDFLLLRKFGAPLEEQIAGLIHDVSHTVFSHCADYALEGGSEKENTHQDSTFDGYVRNSNIFSILKKYDFDPEYILNDKNFPLKENNIPDLCSDRIDYILRTGIHYAHKNQSEMSGYLNNLETKDGKWIFKNYGIAKEFADFFMEIDNIYFSGLPTVKMFRTVGDALRYAYEKGYVTKADFYTTDKEVLEKIKSHLDDKKMKLLFERMDGKVEIINNPENYDVQVFCKSRAVDPLFADENGVIKRVSDIDKDFKNKLAVYLKPKEYFLKFSK